MSFFLLIEKNFNVKMNLGGNRMINDGGWGDFLIDSWDDSPITTKSYESMNFSKSLEDCLNMDYESLKNYIYSANDLSLLKDLSIKKKLIDGFSKYDFVWFVQDSSSEILFNLLDEEGIEILKNTTDLETKLNAIITCGISSPYVFQSDIFCELLLAHWEGLNHLFSSIDGKEAVFFLHYLEIHNPDKEDTLFLKLNAKAQVEVLKEITFPLDMVKEFLVKGTKEAVEYIFSTDLRISSISEFSFAELYSIASKGTCIPSYFLSKKSCIDKITTFRNVKDYRYLIKALKQSNDTDEIEAKRKEFYDAVITSYDEKEEMLECYLQWYQKICSRMSINADMIDLLDELLIPFYGKSSEEYYIREKIINFCRNNDREGLKIFFQRESHLQLTNMVIDYHFEEIPYNFFLDLKQLLHFQDGEGRTLSSEEIETYSKLLALDDLPYKELLKLHAHLKAHSMVEEYYDHFRGAKDKQASLIEKAMLTESSIQKYKDEKLSSKAGVPIYVLEGDEFYALVKCSHTSKNKVLSSDYHTYVGDGGSFSLDGSNKLDTFHNPREMYTFIYKSIPKSQIIHTYPVDSYTLYERGLDIATPRIYELLTPKELVGKSTSYNEILLALPNHEKKSDELQASLKGPELLGIYCYDTITDNDVISAKNMGIGIVLVKTKCYRIDTTNRMNLMETHLQNSKNEWDYLRSISINDMEGRRK